MPDSRRAAVQMVTLGKKGQVSIPRSVLETTSDGSIVLRRAGVYPLEIYGPERLREFEEADRMSRATAAKVRKVLKKR
jgi:hypothetical protein